MKKIFLILFTIVSTLLLVNKSDLSANTTILNDDAVIDMQAGMVYVATDGTTLVGSADLQMLICPGLGSRCLGSVGYGNNVIRYDGSKFPWSSDVKYIFD